MVKVAVVERVGRCRGVSPRHCSRRRGGYIGFELGCILVLVIVVDRDGGRVGAVVVLHLRWLIERGPKLKAGDVDTDAEEVGRVCVCCTGKGKQIKGKRWG